jgi:hypothetical protein
MSEKHDEKTDITVGVSGSFKLDGNVIQSISVMDVKSGFVEQMQDTSNQSTDQSRPPSESQRAQLSTLVDLVNQARKCTDEYFTSVIHSNRNTENLISVNENSGLDKDKKIKRKVADIEDDNHTKSIDSSPSDAESNITSDDRCEGSNPKKVKP